MGVAAVFGLALIGAWIWLIRGVSRRDLRRIGGAGFGALGEVFHAHAAEHQRMEEHAADVDEDDEGDQGDQGDGQRPRSPLWPPPT